MMQMILNELSARFPLDSVSTGKFVMEQFVNTYFTVKDIVNNKTILLDRDYQSLELSRGYRLEKWRNDPLVDIETKRKFRSLLNFSAVYDSEEFEEQASWMMDAEFCHQEKESRGCLLAYVLDGAAVSFLSEDNWKTDRIEGIYTELDDVGELRSRPASVPNVSCAENIRLFRLFYQEKVKREGRRDMKTGRDILSCREEYFPNLMFCDNAINQLEEQIGPAEAGPVFKKLLELQEAVGKMGLIFQREYLSKATPESQETLAMFKEEHTIRLPDGRKKLFSWHVRFTGSFAGRIFFEPEMENARIYIGHIGKKLPTVKYH